MRHLKYRYYFTYKAWGIFLVFGILFIVASVVCRNFCFQVY
ncbi:DUF4491 family protein [Anaerotignum faecicola]